MCQRRRGGFVEGLDDDRVVAALAAVCAGLEAIGIGPDEADARTAAQIAMLFYELAETAAPSERGKAA